MLTREEVERIENTLQLNLSDFEIHGGMVRYWASIIDAKTLLREYRTAIDERDELERERNNLIELRDQWHGCWKDAIDKACALQAERDEEAEAHRILWNMYHDVLAEGRLLREALEHAIVALRGYGNMLHEIPDTPLITAEVARVRRLEAVLEAAEAQDPPASANLARALAAYRESERPGGEGDVSR